MSLDLDAIRQRNLRAHEEVCGLADGSREWKMRIPAQPDRDSDLVISEALVDAELLLAEVERLRAKLDGPCGSCHPCMNYRDETWRAAGRQPPHVFEWDEMRAELERLRGSSLPITCTLRAKPVQGVRCPDGCQPKIVTGEDG